MDEMHRVGTSPELEALLAQLTGLKVRFVLVWAREGQAPRSMTNTQRVPAAYLLEEVADGLRREDRASRTAE